MFNKMSFGFLLGVLWMASFASWAQPRISVHPLMAEQGRRGERWNDLFMREVAKQKVAMTPEAEVEAFLEQHGGSCKSQTKCFRDLGYTTQAHYILVGSMMRVENIYTVNMRVLLVNGVEVKKVSLNVERVSKTSEEANAMAVYAELFAELKLESLPPHPPGVSLVPPEIIINTETQIVEKPVEMIVVPGGAVKPKAQWVEELSQQMSPMRKTSYVFLGVAGVTALTGTVFALMADNNHRAYKNKYAATDDLRVVAPENIAAARRLTDKVSAQKTVAIVSLSVAGAAAATGLTLFFISPERSIKSQKVKVGLAPTQGGAVLSLQGVFP